MYFTYANDGVCGGPHWDAARYWPDYTSVRLLEKSQPHHSFEDMFQRHSDFSLKGRTDRQLRDETPEDELHRWSTLPQGVLDRGDRWG